MSTIRSELESYRNDERALLMARYFKTRPGEYAEGDTFWGLSNPIVRKVAQRWKDLPLEEVEELLRDPVHECRLTALLIWVKQFPKATDDDQSAIFNSYLTHLDYVNNWDLVDLSARDIAGRYLFDKDRAVLYRLAESAHLWSQRVALISTFYFINKGDYSTSLLLAERLLPHKHHLIHKAIGWLLREIGKRDLDCLEVFLHQHIRQLPRTTLRYAIEKLTPARRQYYLSL